MMAPALLLESLSHSATVASVPESLPLELTESSATIVNPDQLLIELKTLQNLIAYKSTQLSLEEAVAKGVQNNPDLAKNFASLQANEWQLISSKRQWNPTLILNGGTNAGLFAYNWRTYIQNNYAISLPPGSTTRTKTTQQSQNAEFSPVATLTWSFWDPSRQPSINAAQSSLLQQKYLLDQSARSLISDIQIAYFQVQRTSQLIDSFSQIYEINKKQLDILEARLAIGMVNVAEVEQQRSTLYIQLTTLVKYTNDYIQQTASLARLLSLPLETLVIPKDEAKPQGTWHKTLDETIEDALHFREDILALTSQAEALKWQGIGLLRKYLPVFSVVANGSLSASNGYPLTLLGVDPGNNYQSLRNWNMSAGIGFNWQFDGGQNAATAQSNFAKSRSVLAQKVITEDQAVSQVRSSFSQMQTSAVAMQASREGYRSALLAQEAARARFDVGVGDITSVIQAISQLSNASTQLASAIYNYNSSISELYRYSATWPKGAKNEYMQRINSMRETSTP